MSKINELSKALLGRYVKQSAIDRSNAAAEITANPRPNQDSKKDPRSRRYFRRWKFHDKAVDRLSKEETVNELSKGLLGRYLNKARADHKTHSRIIMRSLDDKKVDNAVKNNEKRNRGMTMAQQKLQTPAKVPASEEIVNLAKEELMDNPELAAAIRKLTKKKKFRIKAREMQSGHTDSDLRNQMENTLANKKLAEIADLAHAGMALAGVVAAGGAEAALHHATGDIYQGAKKHIGGLIKKFKARKSNVASITSQKTPTNQPANDNNPKPLPKVKTTIMHGEETIDELSQKTLKSYRRKAEKDEFRHAWAAGREDIKWKKAAHANMSDRRLRGLSMANKKIKEETQPTFNQIMLAQAKKLGVANQIAYYEKLCEAPGSEKIAKEKLDKWVKTGKTDKKPKEPKK